MRILHQENDAIDEDNWGKAAEQSGNKNLHGGFTFLRIFSRRAFGFFLFPLGSIQIFTASGTGSRTFRDRFSAHGTIDVESTRSHRFALITREVDIEKILASASRRNDNPGATIGTLPFFTGHFIFDAHRATATVAVKINSHEQFPPERMKHDRDQRSDLRIIRHGGRLNKIFLKAGSDSVFVHRWEKMSHFGAFGFHVLLTLFFRRSNNGNLFDQFQIEAGVNSLNSLLEKHGMISRMFVWGDPEPVYYDSTWVRAEHGGILFSEINLGANVSEGEVLGYVADPITNEQHPIRSTSNGRIIGMAVDQVVMAGFAAYHIGTEAEVPGE